MKKLIIENNKVANIIEADGGFNPAGVVLIDYVDGAAIGQDVINGAVVLPTPKTAEELETERLLKIEAENIEQSNQIDQGKSLIRALAVEVFKLMKVADPTLTPLKFKQKIKANLDNF